MPSVVVINNRVMNALLRSPLGAVTRHMSGRAKRVQRAAQRNVNSRSGALARSINIKPVKTDDGATGFRIGSDLYYARWVHDGTGVYGPAHRPIRPQRGKALKFSGAFTVTYAASSRGQRGTKFLTRALHEAG